MAKWFFGIVAVLLAVAFASFLYLSPGNAVISSVKVISDNFDRIGVDGSVWNLWKTDSGDVQQANGSLSLAVQNKKPGGIAGLVTERKFSGDFDAEMMFSDFVVPPNKTEGNIKIIAKNGSGDELVVYYFRNKTDTGYWTDYKLGGSWKGGTFSHYDGTSGKLRIKREGTIMSTYFFDQESGIWFLLGRYPAMSDKDVYLYIGLQNWEDSPEVSASIDSFRITSSD